MLFRFIIAIYIFLTILILFVSQKLIFKKEEAGKKLRHIYSIVFLILSFLSILNIYFFRTIFGKYFAIIGNLWLGFIFYMLLFLIISLPLGLIYLIIKKKKFPLTRKLISFFAIFCVCLLCYGNIHSKDIKTKSYKVESSTKYKKNLKIVFVTDLHLGFQVGEKQMQKMVEKINAQNPDIVFFGGDIFDSNFDMVKNPQEISKTLKSIKSKYGSYGVWGNHDVNESLLGGFSISPRSKAIRDKRMDKFMQDSDVKMLEDQVISLADGQIELVARLDGEKTGDGINKRKSLDSLFKNVDSSKNVIVLEHEPVGYQKLEELGADLVLSGHTHDGQFFPLNIFQKFIWENSYGMKKYDDMTTIVTSGVGLYGTPVRIATDSEITVIDYSY